LIPYVIPAVDPEVICDLQVHVLGFRAVKNPEVTEQIVTDEDPLDLFTLLGTLAGAFGYVTLVFSQLFPEDEDNKPRYFRAAGDEAKAGIHKQRMLDLEIEMQESGKGADADL